VLEKWYQNFRKWNVD